MENFLPSKRLLIYFVLPIILVCIFLIVSFNSDITYKNEEVNYTETAINKIKSDDSDNDGLKDWEEALWKTDPNNPDTDGDGTKDGEEVKTNRDPNLSSLNDSLKKIGIQIKQKDTYNDNLTETDKLARDFFVGYTNIKDSGGLTEENQEQFLSSLIEKNIISDTQKQYTYRDIKVTAEDVQKYYNNIQDTIDQFSLIEENILITISKFAETDKKEDLDKLEFAVQIYKDVVDDLLKTPTPQSALIIHLGVINALNSFSYSINEIKYLNTDPVRGLSGLSAYNQADSVLSEEFKKLNDYFNQKNVN
ncbi:hypothetical protein ACFLY7_00145 [Patescibacteria group bacterium]